MEIGVWQCKQSMGSNVDVAELSNFHFSNLLKFLQLLADQEVDGRAISNFAAVAAAAAASFSCLTLVQTS